MGKPFYTLEETTRDVQTVLDEGFYLIPGFLKLTMEQVQQESNGTGPGSWSSSRRRFLTGIEPEGARLATIAHDIGYCCPDKSRAIFDQLNQDLYDNQRRHADLHHSDDPVKHAYCLAWAEAEYQAVHLGGWGAWIAGDCLQELAPLDEGPEVLG